MKLIREELGSYSPGGFKLIVDGKEVDRYTIELDGIDTNDYPDFVDAYITAAKFKDGTPLDGDQIDQLNDNYYGLAQELAGDQVGDIDYTDLTDDFPDMLEEMTTLAGGDNVTDVDGYMMDTSTNNELEEVIASTLKVGERFTLGSSLGKFVKGDKVVVTSIKPFGNDLMIVLTNGKDTDDFYIDRNDEL